MPDKRMLNHTPVVLLVLYKAGKSYNWKRPSCPNGCEKVWGHGYVARYFEGFLEHFWLKRYRCPTCGIVITMLPEGYFQKYQSSAAQIYQALKYRLAHARWPKHLPRQRGGHWLRKFIAKLSMDFPGSSPPWLLDHLFSKEINFLA